jgi:hypothetical protein
MKKLIILIAIIFISTSCADKMRFTAINENGESVVITAKPYGWANKSSRKIEGVEYRVNVGNIFWDVVLLETAIVPIWLTGWQFYEPVGLETGNIEIKNGKIIE